MSDTKVMNRWLVVVGAILIQLCLGAIYAWSVFTPALSAKQPADVVGVYAPQALKSADKVPSPGPAPQLDLDGAQVQAMRDEIIGPVGEVKALAAKLKGATDEAKIDTLKAEKSAKTEVLNALVAKHVSKEKLDALSFGMSKTRTMAVFSAGLAAFALVMVLAGRMLPKLGPTKLAVAGGLVLGVGYVLGGLFGKGAFWPTFILIGLVGGGGIGLGYVVPIKVGMAWFPDKKGMVSGLAVAGFGFGALLWVKLAGSWGGLIAGMGLGTTFVIYGVAFFLLCAIGAIWMKNPPEGWKPAGYEPPVAQAGKAVAGAVDYNTGQMLATPQFYMIFLCFVFGAGAGLMSIGLMKAFPMKAMMASGMDWQKASAIAGTAMAVFFSLANGIGRIVWGTLSDKLGRKASIFIMLATQGVIVIAFPFMAGSEYLLYVGATLIGFNFGGNFALFPSITADTFGSKYIGQNYGWVFLSYGVGGIAGPIMGGKLGDMGNFPLAFTICGALCLVAAVIAAMIKPPKHA